MTTAERNYNRRYASEYNIFRSIWYMFFLYTVVVPFFSIFYDYEITGRENLPKWNKKDKYIFTANHVSIFDQFLVPFAAKKRTLTQHPAFRRRKRIAGVA